MAMLAAALSACLAAPLSRAHLQIHPHHIERPMIASTFDTVFDILETYEGDTLDMSPADNGNWTGGKAGLGRLLGSRWGLSSAQYPGLDLTTLTRDAAKAVYMRDYWKIIRGDDLPPPLALLVFDAAVNNGVPRAVRWLQALLGIKQDGIIGEITLGEVRKRMGAASLPLMSAFQTQRMRFMTNLAAWSTDGHAWSARLSNLPFRCMAMT
jgi:lysozyme family protein